jgi:hypothetical protein
MLALSFSTSSGVNTPVIENPLSVIGAIALPFLRRAIDRVGSKRPPERNVFATRRVTRIKQAVARAIAHQHAGKSLRGTILEAVRNVVDMIHAEEDIVGARNIGIEGSSAVRRRIIEREVQRHQTMVAPMPGLGFLPHRVGK